MKIATHSGIFHADDVCAIAVLQLAGVLTELIRTRDEVLLATCDLRVDVGRQYDPATGDFDHHQPEGAGVRANGIPLASFGLIWQAYGARVAGSAEAAALVDERLVQLIDAEDTGYDIFDARIAGIRPYTISTMLSSFNLSWEVQPTPQQMDEAFMQAVEVACALITREVTAARAQHTARQIVEIALQQSTDPRLIVLERYVPWKPTVIAESATVLYVLYPIWPHVQDQWAVEAVNIQLNSFAARKPLPEAWAGKTGAALAAVTGVSDAVFCHTARFLVIAGSKVSALKLAELALAA